MNASRPLGIWSASALVVGGMIGSGAFLLPAALAPYGAASLSGWAITIGGAMLLALNFAWLAMRWPQSGGPYLYARNAFGELPGFVVAWSYWISVWTGNAAIAIAFAGSIGAVFPSLTATSGRAASCALSALWLCTAVNLAGLREAGRLQVITTVLKLVPLLLFGAVALWFVDPRRFVPFNPGSESLLHVAHATAALTLWALLGLEAATVPAGSIQDAQRTVPRATVLGTLLAGVTTVLACTAVLGILPGDVLAGSQAPMAEAATALWGPVAGTALALTMAVSCFGALNGWVLVSSQLPLAAARDGLFPQALARVDGRGIPVASLLASSGLATALILSNYSRSLVQIFTFTILLSTAAILVPYIAASAAGLRDGDGGVRRAAAALALVFAVYALSGIGAEALIWGTVLIGIAVPIHLLRHGLRRASSHH